MSSRGCSLFRTAAAIVAAVVACAAAADGDWKFDVLHHRNGTVFRGLVVEDTPAGVRFQDVRRRPGRPTVVFTTTFSRGEIARIEKLSADDRAQLAERLREIESSGRGEQDRMERADLEPVPWDGRDGEGRQYRSEFFVLKSDAPEDVVRRTAVRLEQIFTAYSRYLPPRVAERPPTEVLLFRSRADYDARLRALGLTFANLAYFDPAANRVVSGSEIAELGQEFERVRRQHQQLRQELDKQEATLLKLYRGSKDVARHVQPIRDTRRKLDQTDRRNDDLFDRATRRQFAVLYHEAFHAYVASRVYAPSGPELPRWLNEGLAQVFESAIIEAGELRVGHADPDRLARAQAAARAGDLVPVARLVGADAKAFQTAHGGDRRAADRIYLTAWAAAFHLAFDRRLLGTPALDAYAAAHAGPAGPQAAFEALVGTPTETFDAELRRYISSLRPDGTTASGVNGK